MIYGESCHKCIRSWYFSWPALKYTDHYTDLIHSAASLYLSYTNRYIDCVRPEEGPLYRRFYAVPFLIKTEIPSFFFNQGSSAPSNLMSRVKTIWKLCLFRAGPSVLLTRVADGDIWFLTERNWSQESFHGNGPTGVVLFLLWCIFLVPNLKSTALTFLEIFLFNILPF